MKNLLKLVTPLPMFLILGCIPYFTFLPGSEDPDLYNNTVPPVKVTFESPVYYLGKVQGDLSDEVQGSITLTAYDGISTNGPILIDGSEVNTLTAQQSAGILATYNAGHPIILLHVTADQIVALHTILGHTDFDFTMPEGITYAEVYATDLEPEGDMFQWVQYPPTVSETDPDNAEDQQSRVNLLVDWLKTNGKRMDTVEAQTAKREAKDGNDLTQLAAAFVNQSNFSQSGNNYQITHYIYSCHSYDTGDDWFYVQQQGVFNGSGAYAGRIEWYKGGAGDVAYWYMDKIEMDTWMKGYDNNAVVVGMQQSSPETANTETLVTSGVSFNIGGEIGVDKNGPSAKISGGVTISNSKTVNVKDCVVLNKSNDRLNNSHWLYTFKKCDSIAHFAYAGLTDPPALSVNTFQPLNQWIWRMRPELRQNSIPMRAKLKVDLVGTTGMWDFMWVAHPWTYSGGSQTWEYDVRLKYPTVQQ